MQTSASAFIGATSTPKIHVLGSVGRALGRASRSHGGSAGPRCDPSPGLGVSFRKAHPPLSRKDNCWRRHFKPKLEGSRVSGG